MTLSIAPDVDLLRVDMLLRDLERREHFERSTYILTSTDQFGLCEFCEFEQGLAVLSWSWDRHDSFVDGSAECCADIRCVRAVLSAAEQDADPEAIEVEYPVAPAVEARLAA